MATQSEEQLNSYHSFQQVGMALREELSRDISRLQQGYDSCFGMLPVLIEYHGEQRKISSKYLRAFRWQRAKLLMDILQVLEEIQILLDRVMAGRLPEPLHTLHLLRVAYKSAMNAYERADGELSRVT